MQPEENQYKKVISYITSHMDDYTPREIQYMIDNYDMGSRTRFAPDVLRQIYDTLEITPEKDNMYRGFVSLLKENFDINTDIIEVGGGVIPVVAKHIREAQTSGSVTVYDPRVSKRIESTDGFQLRREMFQENTNVGNASLIIGFMPCQATELIIRKAVENNADFLIALCEGGHYEFDDYFDEVEWRESIKYLARRELADKKMGTLEETDLKSFGDPYPVIYSKRRNFK
ncbi:MAG: hypothetical protein IJ193_08640 [Bacilli bacterium]|nr:hypothetical protein [Bacilli bacterium]